MPKSKIIKDLVNEKVSLKQTLRRLYVLANDVEDYELAKWANNEIKGYSVDSQLPDYRQQNSRHVVYSGINGSFQVTNITMPAGFIREELWEKISKLELRENIGFFEDIVSKNNADVGLDLTFLAGEVNKNTNGEVTCTNIRQLIPMAVCQSIIETVKQTTIEALLELENKYGTLDELGIDVSDDVKSKTESINININPTTKNEKWYSKIAWNIVTPIITGVLGAVIGAIAIKYIGV